MPYTEKAFDAVQWTGDNLDEVKAFLGDTYRDAVREILAVRDAKDDPTGRQRTDGLLKPTGEVEWLMPAFEVGNVYTHLEIGDWVLDRNGRFEHLTGDEFAARFESTE